MRRKEPFDNTWSSFLPTMPLATALQGHHHAAIWPSVVLKEEMDREGMVVTHMTMRVAAVATLLTCWLADRHAVQSSSCHACLSAQCGRCSIRLVCFSPISLAG
mmetsp:Transcript_39980/g.80105  ORF Transcript_39980/g.80105 Transcript_39980/m.80105 type:complete len:104 (-) Transcript_39980:577-888(-)